MKKLIYGIIGLAGISMLASVAHSQVLYTTFGGTYSQNFDNLFVTVPANNTTTTTSAILPTGWSNVEAGTNANTSIRVDNGSSGTGDSYLYGATNSNERAFGAYSSGSMQVQFGLQITNNTGATLTQFTLTYDGEQWKDGGSATAIFNVDAFSYSIGATSLTAGTYTNDSALNFTAPVNNNTADVTTDGNSATWRTAGITDTITGLNWTNGSTLWLRWTDLNDAGNDDGLAIDNVLFTAVPEPSTYALLFASAGMMFWVLRRKRTQNA